MGAANVIPGVSGGTIAFITGIYERLINALKSMGPTAIKLLFKRDIKAFAAHIDLYFLISLGLGVICSVFTLAKVLKVANTSHPVWVSAFFFGLILASIFSVGRMVKNWAPRQVLALVIGLSLAVTLVLVDQAQQNRDPMYLAICGIAAMCSMIIPGISGSFILLLMGNYELIMLESINMLRLGEFGVALPILIPVGIGAVAGLIALSHILSWLFKTYHDTAVALITGFVAGSLAIIWPWKEAGKIERFNGKEKIVSWKHTLPDFSTSHDLIAAAIVIAGIALIVVTEYLAAKGNKTTN